MENEKSTEYEEQCAISNWARMMVQNSEHSIVPISKRELNALKAEIEELRRRLKHQIETMNVLSTTSHFGSRPTPW